VEGVVAPLPLLIAGIAAALAMVLLGVWDFCRK
jgi:hypothetical protein